MKREDLKAKGLSDEVIDYVMSEHGKDITKLKSDNEELSAKYKEINDTFTKSSEQLKQLDTFSKENGELKTLVETMKSDNAKALEEIQIKANARVKNLAIDNYLTSHGARNVKAVKALFDDETFAKTKVKDDGTLEGFDEVFSQVYKDNDYLFNVAKPKDLGTGGSNTANYGTGINKQEAELRAAFGLKDESESQN